MKQTEIRLGTHGEDYGNWMPNLILYTAGGIQASTWRDRQCGSTQSRWTV